jgi:hypothetical protein
MDPAAKAAFDAELEKHAGVPGSLAAALLTGLAAGNALWNRQLPQARTDQIVRAQGGMSREEFDKRRARRGATLAAVTGGSALAAGAAFNPLRKAAIKRAGEFVHEVADPTMARLDEAAAAASRRHAEDIADELAKRGKEVGFSVGQGIREGLDLSSLMPKGGFKGMLGRLARRG